MNVSRPVVHPIEAPPVPQPPAAAGAAVAANNNNNNDDANNQNIPWMKDIQGMPGTPGGLALRLFQFVFAAAALCVMVTTSDFTSVTAFCYLVAVAILQSSWSLSLAFVDIYAIMVGRCLRNPRVVCLFTVGDGSVIDSLYKSKHTRAATLMYFLKITSTLTFAAACASAGITVLIGNDIGNCSQNHCTQFETATAMAFLSWFAVSPSFLLNFWLLASR